ncbi:MAG: carbamoyltransferase HypF [Bacteroidota bacterium]
MNWHIHIQGQVQGVGFRPFVYALAQRHALNGWVNNTNDGVHIELNAERIAAQGFLDEIMAHPPRLAEITSATIVEVKHRAFADFRIIHSDDSEAVNLVLTPDFALCEQCREEVHAPESRRKGYAFTSCTDCGPRYSIIRTLPYDRPKTTMDAFPLCGTCQAEYDDPADRRYFAQTNSCPDCSIDLQLYDAAGKRLSKQQEEILEQIPQLWRAGKIVAIKGIGGYLLTCDANYAAVVAKLRQRKHRPSKPFAVMFPNLDQMLQVVDLDKQERDLLQSPTAPIVLARLKPEQQTELSVDLLAPKLNRLGVMLPYAPLYEILLAVYGQAIVATSANVSGSPIVFQDDSALEDLVGIADYVLANEREIVIPQDDSVVQFTGVYKERIIMRRSRGWAPSYIHPNLKWSIGDALATGAMLKSTFALSHRSNTYISQYLGDLDHFGTQEHYRHCFEHLQSVLTAQPKRILCDQHPEYPSTRLAEAWSERLNIPVQKIQHHEAHFGAILGEHKLIHTDQPILGIIWDGTGLGTDGQIWGGEFFRYENYGFQRYQHFAYFPSLAGDKMAKEPRLAALAISAGSEALQQSLKQRFSAQEWRIYQNRLNRTGSLLSSSVGRLFDAVAALVLGADRQSYEGEAAIQLQALAEEYTALNGLDNLTHYTIEQSTGAIPTRQLLNAVYLDLNAGKPKACVAAKFHLSLVMIIKSVAAEQNIRQLAFSGGVFQNGLLVDLLHHYLAADYRLYFHQQLSPNDENISFGQMVCAEINHQRELSTTKTQDHVLSNPR